MNIILLGAPGAGKGTQAEKIIDKYNMLRVATGDMLRLAIQNQTETGMKVKDIMAAGKLVPEDIILSIVKEELEKNSDKSLLFDGFPRTVQQAEFLKSIGINVDYVVEIDVPDENIVSRLGGRWVHSKSGRVYHAVNNPPKEQWLDDETGEPLEQREDDKPETVKKRLKVYHETTAPVVKWYQSNKEELSTEFFSVDGTQDVDAVFASISENLSKK